MTASILRVYSGWEKYNSLIETAIGPLTQEQLDLRPAEGLWSIRVLAGHIIGVRAWWFGATMGEGGEELRRFVDFDDHVEENRTDAAALVDGLSRTWASLATSLKSWSDADLDQQFQRPSPNREGQRPWRTREYIVWHVAEHDVFHGGEISLLLGMNGLKGLGV